MLVGAHFNVVLSHHSMNPDGMISDVRRSQILIKYEAHLGGERLGVSHHVIENT